MLKHFLSFITLSALTFTANATPSSSHIIVSPTCLLKHANGFKNLAAANNLRLIEINEAGIDKLIAYKRHSCGGFIDITNDWNQWNSQDSFQIKSKKFLEKYTSIPNSPSHLSPYTIKYEKQVNQLLKQINPQNMWTRLQALTNYPDRYSRGDTGVEVANEIKSEVEMMARSYKREDVKVYRISSGGKFPQPSVVAQIGSSSEPGIVVGAHMDTLPSFSEGNKPGADDDGTGSVTLLELARILLSSDMHFNKPIYLIWYGATEYGLVGSQCVIKNFQKNNRPISAVMQLDMTGYAPQNDMTMWLIDDYVNKDLTDFIETLIHTYVKQPTNHTTCGFACSDHFFWTQNGIAAAMPFEARKNSANPYIHTSHDTLEKLSLTHMTHFASLAVSFVVELAEPIN